MIRAEEYRNFSQLVRNLSPDKKFQDVSGNVSEIWKNSESLNDMLLETFKFSLKNLGDFRKIQLWKIFEKLLWNLTSKTYK